MTLHHLTLSRFVEDLRVGGSTPEWAVPGQPNLVVVEADVVAETTVPDALAAVVAAAGDVHGDRPSWCDVVADAGDIERIERTVHDTPIASTSLAQVLRGAERRSMGDGILLESGVYSALQAGPEFARWRERTPRRRRVEPDAPVVLVERLGDDLHVMLNRPHVRNALDARLRDELVAALDLARLDPTSRVHLGGVGANYSAGGDLDEFGASSDPSLAHLVRTAAAIGPIVAELGARIEVRLHGACLGSGIEIPAFAHRVSAADDVRIGLPELALGLIPGAGGTWSIPQRIGRHRTAWLALTSQWIDRQTALRWGLVDEPDDRQQK